jgi:hypothetical protein
MYWTLWRLNYIGNNATAGFPAMYSTKTWVDFVCDFEVHYGIDRSNYTCNGTELLLERPSDCGLNQEGGGIDGLLLLGIILGAVAGATAIATSAIYYYNTVIWKAPRPILKPVEGLPLVSLKL